MRRLGEGVQYAAIYAKVDGMAAKKNSTAVANGSAALTPAQLAEVREIEDQVLALRVKGLSFPAINAQLEISSSHRVYKRALARSGDESAFVRAEAIRVEAMRLDKIQEGLWEKATNGDVRAVEGVMQVLKHRAAIFGLEFQHAINAKYLEIEEAKVKLMVLALANTLNKFPELTAEQKRTATAHFIGELQLGQQEFNANV